MTTSTSKETCILNSTRLVLLALWLGAALFFSAVVAPTAFRVLRSFDLPNANEVAGSIVTRALSTVNLAGFVIGVLLLISVFGRRASQGRASFMVECLCLCLIIFATGIGHWVIAARMRALRMAMILPIDQIAADDPRRIAFGSLHGYSVNALGVAMIAALVAIILIARSLRGTLQ